MDMAQPLTGWGCCNFTFPSSGDKSASFFFPSETGNFVLVRLVGRLAGLSNTPRRAEFSGTPSNQTRP